MRYLGFDLGSKTLGISISDRSNTIASLVTTLRFDYPDYSNIWEYISKLIKDEEITTIILGYPKNMDNSIGQRALITMEFKDLLMEKYPVDVILEDERLTSVISNNILINADLSRKKRKKYVDGMSAILILQGYLDKKER